MTEPTRRWYTKFWVQLLGAIAAGGLILGVIIGVDLLKKPHVPDGTDAAAVCKQMVKDRLKSPSSAEFSGVGYDGTSPVWTVTGAVDAENSFGAKLRLNWRCVVEINGGWKLLSLSGLD